ncbi:hypothetical protein [Roseibium sp. Sym1]|uniref:hypothetical protein n=1 Tax=Roseibium sp. Sym1 TaxID=3016006 RepID=UPI0022B49047|nr:hypothetical protein [Roseibium sp. Sym1]
MLSTVADAGPAFAWDLIGSKVVTDRVDRDVIQMPGPGRFKQIRICVYRNPVRIYDVDVRFANGGHQDIKLARRINAGRCSRAIDLKGPRRDIAFIKFIYEETSLKLRRATVRVFGR